MRIDGRQNDELRKTIITPNVSIYAEGSVLIEFGNTKVMCTASLEPGVPKWLQGTGKGWITSEYGMLPRSTSTRIKRDRAAGSGRTLEISRLIGRSLRSVVDLSVLGENQIHVDCDVIQADGGTRTASVTGGFVALALAFKRMKAQGLVSGIPLKNYVAAISVGIQNSTTLLDLCYEEDASAETDMNFVINSQGRYVEIQGTAESESFSDEDFLSMRNLAQKGCKELFHLQAQVIGDFFPLRSEL